MLEAIQKKVKIYIGEYGPIFVDDHEKATYGDIMRYVRSLHHYHIDYVAETYGKVANGKSVTGRHILRMEQTDSFFPRDPNRRWVLARLLNLPPVLLTYLGLDLPIKESEKTKKLISVPAKLVDIEEYYKTLRDYRINGYSVDITEVIEDVKERIDLLHDTVLYAKPSAKQHIIRLLCGYQLFIAGIALDQQCYKAAKGYLTNAIILTREKSFNDLQIVALSRREIFFDEKGECEAALQDFEMALKLKLPDASHMRGRILAVAARSKAYLAQNNDDLSTALGYLDSAEEMTQLRTDDDVLFNTSFDTERYLLDRAGTLVASPLKKLRSSTKAQEYLDQAVKQRTITTGNTKDWRQAYSDLVQAKIYYDEGLYPVAAITAQNVLTIVKRLRSNVYTKDVATLLTDIKAKCPHDLDVTNLELELMKIQQPHLFN